jgi:hypothetical protein
MLEEEDGDSAEVPQVVPQVLIVSAHEDFRLVLVPNEVPQAVVGREDAAGVLAGLLDDAFGLVKGAPDLGPPELLEFTHHTFGHDQEGGVIDKLEEGILQVEAVLHRGMKEVPIHHYLIGRMKLVHNLIEVDVLLVLLLTLDPHLY